MKDHIKEVIDKKLSYEDNKNRIREYLQEYLLYLLYKKKLYKDLVFCGGTALRFLYKTKRFSEDLDFSLSYKARGLDFEKVLTIVKEEFKLGGYSLEIKFDATKNVYNAFLKFSDILFDYNLTPHREEKLSVKMEIDTNPPRGGKEEVTIYNSIFMFYILHYDLPTLFAGKLHALFCREYTKGRDWYDLLWYLTNFKGLVPNIEMLNNAIGQTSKKPLEITDKNWKDKLKEVIEKADLKKIKDDVYRFLENHTDIELLTKENLYKLLS